MSLDNIKKNSLSAWLLATRPKTFGVASAPVITALAITLSDCGRINVLVGILTAILAILMQAITNLENDAGYTKRKAERTNRKGLPRATSLGILDVTTVERAIAILAVLAILITGYFIYLTQWAFLGITLASIAAAYLYMGGPKPIAYTPFGELTVFVFFGIIATCGSYYLQLQTLSWTIIVISCALGLIASAVLFVNNFRDRVHDASIGRKTLCVVLSDKNSLFIYKVMIFSPFVLIAAIVVKEPNCYSYLTALLALPKALFLPKQLQTLTGEALNSTLFATVKLEVAFAVYLTLGALVHATLRWF